ALQDSYPNSYPNTAFASFRDFINESYIARGDDGGLTEFQYTWIWSAILNVWAIGYLIGTFTTPLFTERYGRKGPTQLLAKKTHSQMQSTSDSIMHEKMGQMIANALIQSDMTAQLECNTCQILRFPVTLLGANMCSLLGTSLGIISVSFGVPELLFVARLCSSMMSGISYSSLILFLQETTPTEMRGMTSFLSETAYLAISVLGMGLGMDVALGKRLPFLIGVHLIAGVTAVTITFCLQETPKYLLINKEDRKAATKSLEYYRGSTDANEKVIDSIEKEAKEGYEAPFLSSIPIILKTSHLRKAFLIGFSSMQIILTIIPINYVSTIVLEAHFSPHMAQVSSFVFTACNFLASIFGMFAVDRFGRRPMLLVFGFLNVFFMCAYCLFDRLAFYVNEQIKYGCIVALVGYGITFGGALGPIAFFITCELVPQQFRSAVQAMVFTINTAINFIFSFTTLPLYRLIDVWSFIPLFIVPSLLALIFLFFNLPETKGREIHEIVRALAGKSTSYNFSFTTLPLYRLIDVWSFIPLFIVPSLLALIFLFFNLPETKGREIHEIVRALAGKSSTGEVSVTSEKNPDFISTQKKSNGAAREEVADGL
uniref:MFS domain-containing protein n=1 Tax=Ascaris lumbricoides TaxID=6252 RepID=A0A0M3I9G7_ASCLU